MVSTAQIGAGVGAGAVALVGAEALEHGIERGAIGRGTARVTVTTVGVGSLAVAAGATAGLVPFGPTAAASLAGVGVGSLGWFELRERGLAPRLTVEVPDEVNLAGPIITSAVVSAATLAAATLAAGTPMALGSVSRLAG